MKLQIITFRIADVLKIELLRLPYYHYPLKITLDSKSTLLHIGGGWGITNF